MVADGKKIRERCDANKTLDLRRKAGIPLTAVLTTNYTVARARRKKVNKRDTSFDKDLLAVAELVWQVADQYLSVTPNNDDRTSPGIR